jgi:hypothetical protein
MTYYTTGNELITQPIAENSSTQKQRLGQITKAFDPVYGEGEFIYLKGVASTIVGSAVTWNSSSHATTLSAVAAGLPFPVAFAMSACVAGEYGWYQISGLAVAAKAATICCVAGAGVAVKTTGLISKTGSGKELQRALVATTASAATGRTTVLLHISRPHHQGRIT